MLQQTQFVLCDVQIGMILLHDVVHTLHLPDRAVSHVQIKQAYHKHRRDDYWNLGGFFEHACSLSNCMQCALESEDGVDVVSTIESMF